MIEIILEIIQRNSGIKAAEEIAAFIQEREAKGKDLLERLADLQNGPPLERERKEWEELMKEIRQHLKQSK